MEKRNIQGRSSSRVTLTKLKIMEKINGVVETHYSNGQLESRMNYKDGKLDGLREVWYDNGQLKLRATYKDDKREGLRETWHSNGKLSSRTNYKNGKVVK